MGRRIREKLRPVRTRQTVLRLFRASVWGLLASSMAGIALGAWRWGAAAEIPLRAWSALLASGPILGLLAGLIRRRTWERAAEAVDHHYNLKDRAATALAFLSKPEPTKWHELAVADAETHLAEVQASEVVPIHSPRSLLVGLTTLAAAVAILIYPLPLPRARAALSPPRAEAVALARATEERQKALDELIQSEGDEKLDALMKELKQKIAELQKPGVDPKEEMAKLSEMQTSIAAAQAQLNIGIVDGQLASLGEALASADATEGAGKALQDAKFEQAARELEKLENPDFEKKEAKSLEEKLQQVARAMGDVGMGQIGEAAMELAEGIKGGNNSKVGKGAKGIAAAARRHARRRRINKLLEAEAENIAADKNGQSGGMKGMAKRKSKSPSNTWGRGVAGNTDGDKTNMQAKREVKQITGTPDDEGSSEMETTHSPEGRQQAARNYKEAYRKALKQSEAVLDSEPIPLGHRQTIRKYFELIRPQNDEPAWPEPAPAPGP